MEKNNCNEIDYDYPLKGTIWEDLTLEKYLQMGEEEKQKVKDYLEEINAPWENWWEIDGTLFLVSKEHPTWRRILSWDDKTIKSFIDREKKLAEKYRMEGERLKDNDEYDDDDFPF